MSAPTPTESPISHAGRWHTMMIGGLTTPGTIPRGGIRGFKRETGWDKKLGKGTQGATLTLKTMPPVEGEVTLQLFTDQDFADWDQFVSDVLSIQPAKQSAKGLPIYYPGFSSIALTTVVIKDYTGPEHQGKGMYHVKIQLLEWQQPPPKSIVSTVKGAITLPAITIVGQDPEVAQLEQQVAAERALKQAAHPQ
jgi:hypothetical protein